MSKESNPSDIESAILEMTSLTIESIIEIDIIKFGIKQESDLETLSNSQLAIFFVINLFGPCKTNLNEMKSMFSGISVIRYISYIL